MVPSVISELSDKYKIGAIGYTQRILQMVNSRIGPSVDFLGIMCLRG